MTTLAIANIETILLALLPATESARDLPPVTATLPYAELLHRAFVSDLGHGKRAESGFELIGLNRDGDPLRDHGHAHILPLDLDSDGRLDHALVWTRDYMGAAAVNAVTGVREIWDLARSSAIGLFVTGMGNRAMLRDLPDPWGRSAQALLGPARVWRSLTPFVAPRHLKPRGKNSLAGQLAAELAARNLPQYTSVALADPANLPNLRHYVLERTHGGTAPPVRAGHNVELTFAEPIQGPLCLGYGSHFGLGLFAAAAQP